MMADVKFCTVTSKAPADPWYDLGTLEVIKMAAAAKLMSGPNVASATPGSESAQYDVDGVCGRKNAGPRAKAIILAVNIQCPGNT